MAIADLPLFSMLMMRFDFLHPFLCLAKFKRRDFGRGNAWGNTRRKADCAEGPIAWPVSTLVADFE